MRIDFAGADDVRAVALNMRETDFLEFAAVNDVENREQLADLLAERYGTRNDIICAYSEGDDPVAIGAVMENRPNVATLFFFATDRFREVARGLTRWIVKSLFVEIEAEGIRRIECWSMAGNDVAHRWIEHLGLTRRFEDEGFGKNGETFVLFTRVADVHPTSG